MKSTFKHWIRRSAPCWFFLATGCANSSFWAYSGSFAEPSVPANIQLYSAPQKNDLLVEYDELPARKDTPRRRGYFLLENDIKIRAGERPRFVKTSELSKLSLFAIPNSSDPGFSSLSFTNYYLTCDRNHFSINGPTNYPASFELPTYKSLNVPLKDVLFTGPAIVASSGVVLGAVAAYGYVAGRAGMSVPDFPSGK
jgi:hypothetical protein